MKQLSFFTLFAAIVLVQLSANTFAASIEVPFTVENVSCVPGVPGGLGFIRGNFENELLVQTKLRHEWVSFHREETLHGINLCKEWVEPMLHLADKNGGFLQVEVEILKSTEKCCKIVGGTVYAPRMVCWDEPAELVQVQLPNSLILKSSITFRACPLN